MQQPMNTNPVQVVVIAQPVMIDKQIKYKNMKKSLSRQLIGLGITQLIIGILCIIFQGVAVGIFADQLYQLSSGRSHNIPGIDNIGHGFWTGLLFSITGPFGISSGIKRSRCKVAAFNVLSILSASFAACLLSIAIPGAILYVYGSQQCEYVNSGTTSYYNSYSYYYRCYSTGTDQTALAMEALLAILGLMEAIVAIWSAVVCCKIGACCCNCGGSCCCPPAPLQNQFLMAGQPFPGQQQIIFANPQQQSGSNQPQVFMPNQPFSPNQQQPMFLVNPQQPIVNVDPRQQMAQYQPQPPNLPPYSHQPSTYTSLSPDQRDQGSYTGLYNTGIRDTMVYPEQPRIHRGQERAYDNYDSIENGEK